MLPKIHLITFLKFYIFVHLILFPGLTRTFSEEIGMNPGATGIPVISLTTSIPAHNESRLRLYRNTLHMLKKIEHFESNTKYRLYIACSKRNFTLMSKLVLFLMCDKNSGFWSEICDIFVQYIEKIGLSKVNDFLK